MVPFSRKTVILNQPRKESICISREQKLMFLIPAITWSKISIEEHKDALILRLEEYLRICSDNFWWGFNKIDFTGYTIRSTFVTDTIKKKTH